jgi:hypothetical protein
MFPFTQRTEIQRGRRLVKSPKADGFTGSSWIKLPGRLIKYIKEGLTQQKSGIEINVNSRLR